MRLHLGPRFQHAAYSYEHFARFSNLCSLTAHSCFGLPDLNVCDHRTIYVKNFMLMPNISL